MMNHNQWTGSKMIVWGGAVSSSSPKRKNPAGGIYDPETNKWSAMSEKNAPAARLRHSAIWTGSQMIIWGGERVDFAGKMYADGGIYTLATNSWSPISATNVPSARSTHSAVWTGNEMIIFGADSSRTGGIYNPMTNSWKKLSIPNASTWGQKPVWTGTQMLIWGPNSAYSFYDPKNDIWQSISKVGEPTPRVNQSAIWTGQNMIIWGGFVLNNKETNTGGIYNP